MKRVLLIVCCILIIAPLLAQSQNTCSPVGTWYGGSDVKYLFTITAITGEKFATRAEVVGNVASAGAPGWTSWSGELVRISGNRYLGQYISMYTSSPEFPPPADSFEVDAARGYLSFVNCDNIKIEYDFYLVYFDLSKIVFVDQPDVTIDITGSVETYHRMPMGCPACKLQTVVTPGAKKY